MKSLYLLLCCLPLKHLELTSDFDYRIHPITKTRNFHSGIDLRARNDTVYAISSGFATAAYDRLFGLNARIADSSFCCIYGHLSQVFGSGPAMAGTAIGISGYAKC